MIWNRPLTGDERTKKIFAVLPVKAGNEIRWMGRVAIHQSYNTDRPGWNNDWFE